MGGALAQIAAAYYSDLAPSLVTFATPSIGTAVYSHVKWSAVNCDL